MNERIRELAKQTGYIWHASGDPQVYEFTPNKLEKFAELIVRECAEIASNPAPGCHSSFGNIILEHFGVE